MGVGSVLMGDDGVGPAGIEMLRRSGMGDRAELIDAGLAFSEALCELDPLRPLVILDALRGGCAPGSVYRIALADLSPRDGSAGRGVSLHEISVLPALRMEALAGREFADVTIFGVEPDRIAWGEGLSRSVAEAMGGLVRAVCDYLDELAASEPVGEHEAVPAVPAACGSENR